MTERKSTGRHRIARAVWYSKPGAVDLRPEHLNPPAAGEVLIRSRFSGISRGTERLILNGEVPKEEFSRMRAPLQIGEFPFPVKYGYCATGNVETGPNELIGRTVFCLHPHQDWFVAPLDMVVEVPANVPAKRATLAANMETALNAHWDAGTGPADRIVVVGAGVVGLLVAYLACRIAGTEVHVIDVNENRKAIVEGLGASFAAPDASPLDADIVFHTSAHEGGLTSAINHAGFEGRIIEMSWYGQKPVSIPLGGAFHSRRLQIHSSQVGQVSPGHRARWPYRRRLEAALRLLDAPILDELVGNEIALDDVPDRLTELLLGDGLAPVIRYPWE